jgi:hypothetical protein
MYQNGFLMIDFITLNMLQKVISLMIKCTIEQIGLMDICYWNNININWKRDGPNMIVILKVLNNPASITLEFINKV